MRSALITIWVALVFPLLVIGASVDPFASGLALFNQGKREQAVKQFQAAVDERPDDAVRRLTYGVALANARDYDDAIVQFRAARQLDPSDPTADFLLQGSYQAIGMVVDAQQVGVDAKNKLEDDGKSKGAAKMFPPGAAPEPCSQLLASALEDYPDNAIAHNLFGDVCQVKHRYEESIVHYRRAAQLAPGWVEPWFNLGMANLAVNPAEAERDFQKVIALDPKNLQAQMWLGDAYAAQRDYPQALRAYNEAANSRALEPAARVRMGNVYLKQQQLDEAAGQFDQAITAQPQNATAAAGLGDVYRQQKKLDESAKQYQRAADLTQQSRSQQVIANNSLANVYIDKGECVKAIEELKKAIGPSDQPEGARMLLDAYARCRMLPQGISDYESALKKHPGDIAAMRFLVAAYERTGNALGRMEMARRLLKSLPAEAPQWNGELAASLLALGDRSGALDAWKRGLEASPTKDAAGIIRSAYAAGALKDLRAYYEQESETHKLATPSLVLALICERTGDYAKAVEVRRRLVKLYPGNQHYWIWLGDAERLAGSPSGARNAYTKAASMNEDITLRAIAAERLKGLKK